MSHLSFSETLSVDPAFIINLALHITVITAVVLILDARSNHAPALRHASLATALMLVVLSPLSVTLLQDWNVGVLNFGWSITSSTETHVADVPSSPRQYPSTIDEASANSRQPPPARQVASDFSSDPPPGLFDGEGQVDAASSAPRETVSPINPGFGGSDWTESPGTQKHMQRAIPAICLAAIAIWLLGTFVVIIRVSRSMIRLHSILRDARSVSDVSLQREFRVVCRWLRLGSQKVALMESERVQMPIAVGVVRPRVVVPVDLLLCRDRQRLREVFVHELAHIARRDQIVVWVQHFVAALYWWHPFVRRLNRRLAQAREEVCDNCVLSVSDATHYGRTLLDLTERGCGAEVPRTVAGLLSSRWKLEQRVSALLDKKRSRSTRLSLRGVSVVALSATIALWLAGQSSITFGSEEPQVPTTGPPGSDDTAQEDQSTTDSAAFSGTILDHERQPAEGATVILVCREQDQRTLHRLVTRTDASGKYEFDRVPVARSAMGYHALLAYLPGHAFARRSTYGNATENANANGKIVTDISLVEADATSLIVVDEQGAPVPGAMLESLNTRGDSGSKLWIQEPEWDLCDIAVPVTNESGKLSIPGIDGTRSYDLRISHPDYAATPFWNLKLTREPKTVVIEKGKEVRFDVSCESDPAAVSEATISVVVSEVGGISLLEFDVDSSGAAVTRLRDQHSTINIRHPRLEGLPWYFYKPRTRVMPFRLYPTGTVKGRVVDPETGEGVAEVSVQFAREQRVVKQAETDADGNYECELAATSYKVSIGNYWGRWTSSGADLPVDVISSKTVALDDLEATARPTLRGRVELASGEPVSDAIVVQSFYPIAVLSDQNGEFEFQPQMRFNYPFRVLHPYEKLSRAVPGPSFDDEWVVRLSNEGVLTGVLRDSSGRPLPNLEAGLRVVYDRSGRSTTSTVMERTQTDEQGMVRFVGLSEGFGYGLSVGGITRSSRNQMRSESFDVPNLPAASIELSVDAQLQSELEKQREMNAASPTVLPFGKVKWLGNRNVDVENFDGQWLLVASASYPSQFAQSNLAQELYGDRGLVVVGVLSTSMSNLHATEMKNGEDYRFPVAIDNDEARIMERYGHLYSGDVLVFNARGKLVRKIHRGRNLLTVVRNLFLYGE